jgi:hypothetical protein
MSICSQEKRVLLRGRERPSQAARRFSMHGSYIEGGERWVAEGSRQSAKYERPESL